MPTKSIAWNTGNGNITLTYQGQGDGTITVSSDENTLGSSRSQTITVETVGGAVTQNLTISQAACPFPVGDVKTYSYTGSYQEVELPAGQYKFQCWGAQGGSNAAASSYSITAKAGGKGGYAEGILTISQKTTVRVYVGGQGSSSSGGYNGGGSTTGSSTYNSGNTYGTSRMGGGGGATDIRLSDGALLSRMIVAGGGSGGAMCYKAVTTTTEQEVAKYTYNDMTLGPAPAGNPWSTWAEASGWRSVWKDISSYAGKKAYINDQRRGVAFYNYYPNAGDSYVSPLLYEEKPSNKAVTIPSGAKWVCFMNAEHDVVIDGYSASDFYIKIVQNVSSTTTSTDSQVGYAGGGTSGLGTYPGTQSSAGSNGSFGQGANMSTTGYRYCSGAGGGGWYGGGSAYSDSTMSYVRYMGSGSGWVNIAANASYRPSGYTGKQLDSGTTYAGNTSFPSTSGGTETGHSGNGYAKITRLS